MNTLRFVADCTICVCSGLGFIHGMIRCFGKDKPLYLKAMIGAFGCMMAGRLFATVLQLCGGDSVSRLNLGYIGLSGCFLFLLSASHGEINEIIKGYKTKLAFWLSILAPIPVTVILWLILASQASISYKALGCIVSVFVLLNVLYFFRFMVNPDGGDGFLRMLRPTSIMLLIFSYAQLGEIYFTLQDNDIMLMVTYLIICIISLLVIPVTERRVTKWTTT